MPFWRCYAHVVWTTKERNTWICKEIESRLYAYIVAKATEHDTFVFAINGMPDHIHVVVTIPPRHSIADVVKVLKGSSAHFVNQIVRPASFHFQWQRGYGCFTLGPSQLAKAISYVERQKEHHDQQTTNRWLEYVSEIDAGPPVDGQPAPASNVIRESPIGYTIDDDWPF